MVQAFPVAVQLLAGNRHLIDAVGELRWREWGHPPEPVERQWWIDVTAREAGTAQLPITWVAIDDQGDALGAVGLAEFDIAERRDRSPWLVGMVVREDRRSRGIGGQLVAALEAWAAARGYERVWVATGGRAVNFYGRCGWQEHEVITHASGDTSVILTRSLTLRRAPVSAPLLQ